MSMQIDAASMAAFYDTPKGDGARRMILRHIRDFWPDLTGQRLLGVGFPAPYMGPFWAETERAVAVIPKVEGATLWRSGSRCLTAAVEEGSLPFADASFDRILVVHGLEASESSRPFLRELWRVLTDNGRIMFVVANRTSLWAQFESTPFGQGRPYSRNQLARLLTEALFRAEGWDSTLFMLPFGKKPHAKGGTWDKLSRNLWPALAGVHLVEASKSFYALAPQGGKPARRPLLAALNR